MASEGPQHPDEMKELERELRALVPRGPKVDLARIMFRAGQASMAPVPPLAPPLPAKPWGTWFWPASAGVMSLVALWLGAIIVVSQFRPHDTPAAPDTPHPTHMVAVPAPVPASTENYPPIVENPSPIVVEPATPSDARYLRDRQVVISQGVDALPRHQAGNAPSDTPGSYGSMNREMLRERRSPQRATFWSEFWKP